MGDIQSCVSTETPFRADWVALAVAHQEWDVDGSPDPALLCFKRVVETLRVIGDDREPISLLGIGCAISSILEGPTCPPADENLFQFYFDRTEIFDNGGTIRSMLRKSVLMLYHPTKPDGTGLLREIKTKDVPQRHLSTHAVWSANSPATTRAFASWMIRLSYISRLQGLLTWCILQKDGTDISQATRLMQTGSMIVCHANSL